MQPHDVSIALGDELYRRQLNARLPNYGDTLPDIDTTPDGKLFTDTTGPTLYQAQAGVWVALT